jgi:hypothetical protein
MTRTRLVLLGGAVVALGAVAVAVASAGGSGGCGLPTGSEKVSMDRGFTTDIDNPFWPMRPGATWTYRQTNGDEVAENIVTVTDDTKDIDGIEARVVRDVVKVGDRVTEDTFDWYAQDHAGNIWYLGEDTKEYDGDEVSTEGSWEHGVDGALAGIALPADPQPGCAYRQEYKKGEAEDNGRILSLHETVQVPLDDYRDAMSTQDWTPLELDNEHKVYVRGVGPVLTVQLAGGAERAELVSYRPGG